MLIFHRPITYRTYDFLKRPLSSETEKYKKVCRLQSNIGVLYINGGCQQIDIRHIFMARNNELMD